MSLEKQDKLDTRANAAEADDSWKPQPEERAGDEPKERESSAREDQTRRRLAETPSVMLCLATKTSRSRKRPLPTSLSSRAISHLPSSADPDPPGLQRKRVQCLPWGRTPIVPTYFKGRLPEDISDWPSRNETKYEGDDRIRTDILHARFPPAPHVQDNGTVDCQQRTVILPQVFGYFFTSPEEYDIFMGGHWIDDWEFKPRHDLCFIQMTEFDQL